MSWLSVFFKKESVKAVIDLSIKLLQIIAGNFAKDMYKVVSEEVAKVEASGLPSKEKFNTVFEAVKKRFPQVKINTINLAIELAVAKYNEMRK